MNTYPNPFPAGDPDRHAIWEMLVERDILAFIQGDWALIAQDFLTDSFTAMDARGHDNPDAWHVGFPDLTAYRDAWLEQSRSMRERIGPEPLYDGLHRATTLRDIEISGDAAIAHKKFLGQLSARDGSSVPLQWQTVYNCRRVGGAWKISGFVGYLPYPMGTPAQLGTPRPAKHTVGDASQHVTAGPYSPVLAVHPGSLVVISGQAAIARDGQVIGTTIEEQAQATLENCRAQLESASCRLEDVFKTNVYMTDLTAWERFNAVYRAFMPAPHPVRTTVQAGLLPGLLIEIEMWAVRP